MSIEKIAEKLLEIADKLEKEAEENTYFVCMDCNHTATLSDINKKRKVAAEKLNLEEVEKVTVNDIIKCAACGGKMMYVPTEDSERYYIEAAEEEEELKDIEEEDKDENEKDDKDEDEKVEDEKDKEDEKIKVMKEEEFLDIKPGKEKRLIEEEITKDKEIDNVKIPKREPPKFEKVTDKDSCDYLSLDKCEDEDFWRAVRKYSI